MENNGLVDKLLICKDCKRKFNFLIGEQEFYGQKGYPDPVRCQECRNQKKMIRLRLEEGVPIAEKIKFSEVCDKCGRKFFTMIKRKKNMNLYCADCWKVIKFGNVNKSGKKDKSVEVGESKADLGVPEKRDNKV